MEKQGNKDELLRAKLNLETAQMSWKELERFFASGALIAVGSELDLVEVATRIANDEKEMVEAWLRAGSIERVTDRQATDWNERQATLWTVVVKPWILVQDEKTTPAAVH